MAKKKAKKSGKKRKPNAAFMKPMTPSGPLAAVIGSSAMPRTEVTKKIWGYIKRNGLQDKKNRRNINADDKLKAVFGGKASVSMFEMTKLVSRHLKKPGHQGDRTRKAPKRGLLNFYRRLFPVVRGDPVHLVLRAEDHRAALVQPLRLQIQDARGAVGRRAARLLDDERHRVGLVHEAQAPIAVLRVARVHEDAAA
jgi:upstream activation factor subunit UAF30